MEYVHQSHQGNLYYSFGEGVILHWVNISVSSYDLNIMNI